MEPLTLTLLACGFGIGTIALRRIRRRNSTVHITKIKPIKPVRAASIHHLMSPLQKASIMIKREKTRIQHKIDSL